MLRRVAVLAAGLALTASVGLAGAGAASAATPALHIKPGFPWTIKVKGGWCEVENMAGDHTFFSESFGDTGGWQYGGPKVKMIWMSGVHTGWKFHGTWNVASKAYIGSFGGTGAGFTGRLIEGTAPRC